MIFLNDLAFICSSLKITIEKKFHFPVQLKLKVNLRTDICAMQQ